MQVGVDALVLFHDPVVNGCASLGEGIQINFVPGNAVFSEHCLLVGFVLSAGGLLPLAALNSSFVQNGAVLLGDGLVNVLAHEQPTGSDEVVGQSDLLD